jgi:hypothetical protein
MIQLNSGIEHGGAICSRAILMHRRRYEEAGRHRLRKEYGHKDTILPIEYARATEDRSARDRIRRFPQRHQTI